MDESKERQIDELKLDLYKLLGLERNATASEIKKRFAKIALQQHPDKNRNAIPEEDELFKEISNAYSILSDPDLRRYYDSKYPHHGMPPAPEHILKKWMIYVSLALVFTGGQKKIKVFGYFKNNEGNLEFRAKRFLINIPKGIKDGDAVTGEGMGGFSEDGKKIIDISIEIKWLTNDGFEIIGEKLVTTHTFTLKEALLGGAIDIQMPDGTLERVYIKRIISPETILTMPQQGMPIRKEFGVIRGDLVIKCQIRLPKTLSLRDIEIIRELNL